MRSRFVWYGVLEILSDYKVHTIQEMADKLEVSYITVQRHIADASLYKPIVTNRNGKDRGVKLLLTNAERKIMFTKQEIDYLKFSVRINGGLEQSAVIQILAKLDKLPYREGCV